MDFRIRTPSKEEVKIQEKKNQSKEDLVLNTKSTTKESPSHNGNLQSSFDSHDDHNGNTGHKKSDGSLALKKSKSSKKIERKDKEHSSRLTTEESTSSRKVHRSNDKKSSGMFEMPKYQIAYSPSWLNTSIESTSELARILERMQKKRVSLTTEEFETLKYKDHFRMYTKVGDQTFYKVEYKINHPTIDVLMTLCHPLLKKEWSPLNSEVESIMIRDEYIAAIVYERFKKKFKGIFLELDLLYQYEAFRDPKVPNQYYWVVKSVEHPKFPKSYFSLRPNIDWGGKQSLHLFFHILISCYTQTNGRDGRRNTFDS